MARRSRLPRYRETRGGEGREDLDGDDEDGDGDGARKGREEAREGEEERGNGRKEKAMKDTGREKERRAEGWDGRRVS